MGYSEGLYRLAFICCPFRAPNDTHAAPKGQNTTGMGVVHTDIPKAIKNPRLPLAAEGENYYILFFTELSISSIELDLPV